MRYLLILMALIATACSGDGGTGPTERTFPAMVNIAGTWDATGDRQVFACQTETSTYCYVVYGGEDWNRRRNRFVGRIVVGDPLRDASPLNPTQDRRDYSYPVAARFVGVDSIWYVDTVDNETVFVRAENVDRGGTIQLRYVLRRGASGPDGSGTLTWCGYPYPGDRICPLGAVEVDQSAPAVLASKLPISGDRFNRWEMRKR